MKIKISKENWKKTERTAGWLNQESVFDTSSNLKIDISHASEQQIKDLLENGKFNNQDYKKLHRSLADIRALLAIGK